MNLVSLYDNVDSEKVRCVCSKQQEYINKCVELAQMSTLTHKHGCVVVNNKTNTIIGRGYNKKVTNYSIMTSIHAEVDAIKNAGSKMRFRKGTYDMYIIRLGSPHGYNIKYSKPCEQCSIFIMKKCTNIRNVFYTVNVL